MVRNYHYHTHRSIQENRDDKNAADEEEKITNRMYKRNMYAIILVADGFFVEKEISGGRIRVSTKIFEVIAFCTLFVE